MMRFPRRSLCCAVEEKRVCFVRHGDGWHQHDGEEITLESGYLGHFLTARGEQQSKDVAQDPIFAEVLGSARQPVFVASNVIRAIQTIVNAAPDRGPIVVQPLVREVGVKPSDVEALNEWFDTHGIDKDLGECYRQGDEAQRRKGLCGTLRSIPSFINWLGSQDGDAIFVASHCGFIEALDYFSYSPCGALQGLLTCSIGVMDLPGNCDVREYRLFRNWGCRKWHLRKVTPGKSFNRTGRKNRDQQEDRAARARLAA
jgi:hypothetical protein